MKIQKEAVSTPAQKMLSGAENVLKVVFLLTACIVTLFEEAFPQQTRFSLASITHTKKELVQKEAIDQTIANCESVYFASKNLKQLIENLKMMNSELRDLRLQGLKADFEHELRLNEKVISNLALLILEALLNDSAQLAARALQTSNRKSLPQCLKDVLDTKDSAKLLSLAQRTESSPSAIHLHPLWHKDALCIVAVNGELAFENSVPHALQGQSFYIQKICQDKRKNELLLASVPYGKDHLYVSPPASHLARVLPEENSTDSSHNRRQSLHLGIQFGLGSGMGSIGKNNLALSSRGFAAQLPYKGYTFLHGSVQLTQQFSLLISLAQVIFPSPQQEIPDTFQEGPHDGLYSQFSGTWQPNVEPTHWTFLPQFGLGVSTIVPGRSSFSKAVFIAPHALARTLFVFSVSELPVALVLGPQFSASIPPFAGWTAAFLIGVQLNKRNTE